jgi:hypothetical protein
MGPSLSPYIRFFLICCWVTLAATSAFGQTAQNFAISPPSSVNITLQGCRNDGTLSPANFPIIINGTPYYICPDKMYTTGNLGKNWAELDNVPFRLIVSDGSKGSGSLTYNVVVAGDNIDVQSGTQHTGYFVVSPPEADPGCQSKGGPGPCLAQDQTDSSCAVSVVSAGDQIVSGITGGTDTTIYETLQITQNRGTTCVFDYFQTLALGSHFFNGSNLQAYKFEDAGFSVGKQTVPLPVNACSNSNPQCQPSPAPQGLSKTMGASEGQGNVWTVAKAAPTSATFNACNLNDTSKNLSVVVTWTETPGAPGLITITTNVYETNPALVPVTVNVTDTINATKIADSSTVQVGTASASGVTVAPQMTQLVLTDTATVDPSLYTTPFSDHADATVVDSGNNSLGSLTADACIDPSNASCTGTFTQGSGSDNSADVTDTESVSDTAGALTFSVQDTVPSGLGSFTFNNNSYMLPGSAIVGPLLWDSDSVSARGSIQFDKTVYLNPAGTATTGDLTDTATVTASDSKTNSDSADVKITSAPVTKLTINKTIDQASQNDLTFTFHVVPSGGNTDAATPQVTIKAGQTSGSIDVTTLAPGAYTVSEDTLQGWQPQASQNATLSTDNTCTTSVEFDNKSVQDLSVTKDAAPGFNRTYTWGITKSVDQTTIDISNPSTGATFNYTVSVTHDSGTDGGWAVTGNITVSNPNPVAFTGVDVMDAIDNGGNCSISDQSQGQNETVPANGSIQLPYKCTYTSVPSPSGFTNTATATWPSSFGAPDTTKSGTATGTFSGVSPTIVDGSVTVTDTFGGSLGTVSYTDSSPKTFKYSHTFTGDPAGTCTKHDNTATFTTNSTQSTGSDTKEVQVCVGADLSVSKTVAVTTPTYSWTLTKSVSPNGTLEQSGSTTLKYTVTASYTKTGSWTVYGTITVANPNNWEDIKGVTVTDALDTGSNGVCVVTGGSNVTVPKSGSVTLNYSCTYSAVPSPTSGTNTVTATWTAATFFTPHGTQSGTAPYAFSPPTSGPTTVTITDNFNNGGNTTLGVINALTNVVTSLGSGVTLTSAPPTPTL